MKLVVRSVGTGLNPNIRLWEPENPDVISEFVHLSVGPKSEKGADTFSIRVATPAGLATLDDKDGIIADRPLLVMRRYEFHELWKWIEKTVASCEAEDWSSCVAKLRLYFAWEYDGYKEC